MSHCHVKFTTHRLGPSAVLYDADGHSINTINYPKGTKLSQGKKNKARRTLMKGCSALSRHGSLGDLGSKPVPVWLAGALALAGAWFAFNTVKTADPNAS
jgi:hypothetical protein